MNVGLKGQTFKCYCSDTPLVDQINKFSNSHKYILLFKQIQTQTFECDCCDTPLVNWSLAIITGRRRTNVRITVNHISVCFKAWTIVFFIILLHDLAHWSVRASTRTHNICYSTGTQYLYQYKTQVQKNQNHATREHPGCLLWYQYTLVLKIYHSFIVPVPALVYQYHHGTFLSFFLVSVVPLLVRKYVRSTWEPGRLL